MRLWKWFVSWRAKKKAKRLEKSMKWWEEHGKDITY